MKLMETRRFNVRKIYNLTGPINPIMQPLSTYVRKVCNSVSLLVHVFSINMYNIIVHVAHWSVSWQLPSLNIFVHEKADLLYYLQCSRKSKIIAA